MNRAQALFRATSPEAVQQLMTDAPRSLHIQWELTNAREVRLTVTFRWSEQYRPLHSVHAVRLIPNGPGWHMELGGRDWHGTAHKLIRARLTKWLNQEVV